MNLHEYHSKQHFAEFGIPILPGKIAHTPEEVRKVAIQVGDSVMIKAQVLLSTRIKRGGILLARTPEEAFRCAKYILGMEIEGFTVRKVLVEPAVNIVTEIYLGITNDRAVRRPVLVAAARGGIDLDELAQVVPEEIIRTQIDPLIGLCHYQSIAVANDINLPREHWRTFSNIAQALYRCYIASDAILAEINPLVITDHNKLLAVDGKMIIDDNALYRQSALAALRDTDIETEATIQARKIGIAYVKLKGQIGCIVNGAGLAMATMDIIKLYGRDMVGPANFLDIGGGARAEKVAAAMRIVLADPDVKLILVNILGGITHCDEVAWGITQVYAGIESLTPLIVRLQGTNAVEGLALIQNAHIPNLVIVDSLSEAAQKAVKMAQGL